MRKTHPVVTADLGGPAPVTIPIDAYAAAAALELA